MTGLLALGLGALVASTPARAAGPVTELLAQAQAEADRDALGPAREHFAQAAERAAADGDAASEARAQLGLGESLYRLGLHERARDTLRRAYASFESRADAHGQAVAALHLAAVAGLAGDEAGARAGAVEALERLESTGDARLAGHARLVAALAASDAGEEEALLEEVLEIARAQGDVRLEGRARRSRGDLFYGAGRYGDAEDELQRAASLFEQAGAALDLARTLNSLSRLRRVHGQVESAIELTRKALEHQEANGDLEGAIQSLDHLADARGAQGDFAQAIALYARASELAARTGSAYTVDYVKGRSADAYLNGGDPARAAALLEEVLKSGATAEFEPAWLRQLARSYERLGRDADALATLDRAIALARAQRQGTRVLGMLRSRAQVRERLGRLDDALADVREQIDGLEKIRGQLAPRDFLKRGFANETLRAFDVAIGLLHQTGHAGEAAELAEQVRARAFLDLLASRDAAGRAADAPAPRVEGLLLRGQGPDLPSLARAAPPSLAEMAATARRLGSTILSYCTTADALYVWAIDASGVRASARVASNDDAIARLVREAGVGGQERTSRGAALVTRGGADVWLAGGPAPAWKALYRLLVAPVAAGLPKTPGARLTIVPDGSVFRVPFAALVDDRGRYLVERYALHYAPSVATLGITAARSGAPPVGRSVFVGDPAALPAPEAGGRALPRLPGTRREILACARLRGKDERVLLMGTDATEAQVRALSGRADVLHFATHAIVRGDAPFESFLALDPGPSGDPADDGRLTAWDVYGLDLPADLVVLSACGSGGGDVSADGVVGLTRAFFYAGAASVVATLWDVPDDPSHRLMARFYASRARGTDKARALREAQLAILRALRAGTLRIDTPYGSVALPEHPMLWAGFALIGEP